MKSLIGIITGFLAMVSDEIRETRERRKRKRDLAKQKKQEAALRKQAEERRRINKAKAELRAEVKKSVGDKMQAWIDKANAKRSAKVKPLRKVELDPNPYGEDDE